MKFLAHIIFILSGFGLAAQSVNDTIYFDGDWKEVSKKGFSFYRTFNKQGATHQVFDHYKNGTVQMTAFSEDVHKLNKDGEAVYYNEDGTVESKGSYKNNKETGRWTWYYYKNGKDSSVADYTEKGTRNFIHICASCQVDSKNDPYNIVDDMPEYPGGMTEMFKFIQGNVNYPSKLRANNIGGKVYIKFIVLKSGAISGTEVIKSSGIKELDEEALRVVGKMPNWKPGLQGNDTVNVYYNLPLNFSLADPYYVLNTNNTNPDYTAANLLFKEGKYKEAQQVYINSSSEGDYDFMYNRGVAFYYNKDYPRACKYFEKVAQSGSDKTSSSAIDNSKKYLQKYCN